MTIPRSRSTRRSCSHRSVTLVPVAMRAFDRGGTLAVAGIYLSDIPKLVYGDELFEGERSPAPQPIRERDGTELLELAARIPLIPKTVAYAFADAPAALFGSCTRPAHRRSRADRLRGLTTAPEQGETSRGRLSRWTTICSGAGPARSQPPWNPSSGRCSSHPKPMPRTWSSDSGRARAASATGSRRPTGRPTSRAGVRSSARSRRTSSRPRSGCSSRPSSPPASRSGGRGLTHRRSSRRAAAAPPHSSLGCAGSPTNRWCAAAALLERAGGTAGRTGPPVVRGAAHAMGRSRGAVDTPVPSRRHAARVPRRRARGGMELARR